ncbi:hypothetical protein ABFS82_10G132600 [Erythranthe guttata]|uniref:Clp R domain-containing protein n=1 Tax=Erythranthe guttata TaxID=4155 RepID=A0A022RQZ8_ERYGU|nr:PREDICTED: uncharacterized protein LOC105952324 [Erythranthe guttata]EYU42459.1 hypothetical protein MIMGU_mgv1a000567mg [Erythranthe guttata]|eukprot:XP_012831321.1 PREDICTED: uncharacterized protein LOC105952324 [Erythranthe guttata]
MRAGLSTIQQTLTPDAATVLNHSISEAGRRNHGQTTPLHVAATLLSSPSGFLRQACIRSHPNSSHPLQCRALELCFSVALERLPTAAAAAQTQNAAAAEPPEPPISNALMAALKRAQAHQRRGCPEQQQQPLLAVKVELEQLVISILDDPSVSRVMREAKFSSPAVKAAIEQSLIAPAAQPHHHHHQIPTRNVSFGSSFAPRLLPNTSQLTTPSPVAAQLTNRNLYLNPRLQPQGATTTTTTTTGPIILNQRTEEVKKVFEIMSRSKKRNPVLVGDSEPESVVKEFLKKIETKELETDQNFKNIQVVSMEKGLFLSDKSRILSKIEELGKEIESKISSGGVVLDLGDLKWLVEQQQKQPVVSEIGRAAVAEMTKLVARFSGGANEGGGGGGKNRLWLIGTATCETYLRCQVYHSTMEIDWDLQAVPIASRSPLPGMFPRLGADRILSNQMESLNPMKAAPSPPMPGLTRRISENLDPSSQKPTVCPKCMENYEKEAARLSAIQKSFSEAKQDAPNKPSLPQWLQNAKLNTTDSTKTTDEATQGLLSKQKTQELQKKWRDTCLHLHPNFHQTNRPDRAGPPSLSMTSLYNPNLNLLSRPPFQPKLQTIKPIGEALQLNTSQLVRTDLVLGREEERDNAIVSEKPAKENNQDQAKDLLSCISSEPLANKFLEKFSNALDADMYKKLLKGLMERAWWQAEAASAVAAAITRCRLGNGKKRGGGSRGDVWLLFTGPDRVGKKKMASVLAEQICGGRPVTICLGRKKRDDEELDMSFRGKTAVDRIAEAVRRNPFLVIVLEDIDEADALVRGSIRRAIERGRITDSHGREVGLGNAVFVVTGDWSTVDPEASRSDRFLDEDKLASVAGGSWQLGLIVREKTAAKRRANWLLAEENGPARRARKEAGPGLSLDLNLSADGSSVNSSDLTNDYEDDEMDFAVDRNFSITSVPHELASNVDESIVFKPVDSGFVRREIKKTISVKFSMVVDEDLPIEVGDDVVKKILGGLWHDRTSLEEWMENVVGPAFDQLKKRLPLCGDRSKSVVRLVVESDSSDRGKSTGGEDWLPSSILV